MEWAIRLPDNIELGINIVFLDITGKEMRAMVLHRGVNELNIKEILDNHVGIIIYQIWYETGIIDIGKLFNLR